ncbi:hypothetical protein F4781DRAFT_310116 [Annulohypoxylon bovei var. microspora]|nr:hypothetical protein F4781DRAFT_310116 [Annulohypoxylon bovei var. microspora]
MGLPLWREPTEDDTRRRSASRSPAHPVIARSPIARVPSPHHATGYLQRRQQLRDDRERRLRLLSAQMDDNALNPTNIESGDYGSSSYGSFRTTRDARSLDHVVSYLTGRDSLMNTGSSEVHAPEHFAERADPESFSPGLGDTQVADTQLSVTRFFDTQLSDTQLPDTQLHDTQVTRGNGVRSARVDDPSVPDLVSRWEGESGAYPSSTTRHDPFRPREIFAVTWPRDTSARSERRRSEQSHEPLGSSTRNPVERRYRRTRIYPRPSQGTPTASSRRHNRGYRGSSRNVDGLGDRDRSLSPEGDGLWSNLQTTITPDPQPPSVGSSFTSTTASTSASHNPTISSSRTSITSPGDDVEPPCDPVNDLEEHEGDDDDIRRMGRRGRGTSHGVRSYAEVAEAGTDADADADVGAGTPLEDLAFLSGMHSIVTRLASRQDIPDEWWARAGLSRSMTWEDDN